VKNGGCGAGACACGAVEKTGKTGVPTELEQAQHVFILAENGAWAIGEEQSKCQNLRRF
jgi:hypothetical protein